MNVRPIPRDPSLPIVPALAPWVEYCDCVRPIRQERAERRGAARTYCARCEREIPIRLGGRRR
jgi:hypothetical protein